MCVEREGRQTESLFGHGRDDEAGVVALELVVEPEEVAVAADDGVRVAAAAGGLRPDLVRDVRALGTGLLRVRDSDHVLGTRLLALQTTKGSEKNRCFARETEVQQTPAVSLVTSLGSAGTLMSS